MQTQFVKGFAQIFNINPYVLQAVINTESRGAGYENGRLKIRFEPHIFLRRTNNESAQDFFQLGDPYYLVHNYLKDGTFVNVHSSQDSEYDAFHIAKLIDEQAAYESISMGSPQIMGFNHRALGYQSAKQMYDEFSVSEINQIIGMLAFMHQTNGLIEAMRNKDWREIARLYNGAGAVDVYSRLIKDEYERLAFS